MNIDELVFLHFNELTDTDKDIYQYISSHSDSIPKLTINELADICHVSRSTVLRFTKKIGLSGYSELKTLIKISNSRSAYNEERQNMESLKEYYFRTIEYYSNLNMDDLIELLGEAKHVYLYGTGALQRSVAEEFARLFLYGNLVANTIVGEGEFEYLTKLLTKDDLLIIISKNGENDFLNKIVPILNMKSIKIISFTTSNNNYLAKVSDYNISLKFESVQFKNHHLLDSLTIMYMIIEIVFLKYISKKNN